MLVEHIITLLEFCLKNTYFLSQGTFYEQIEGTAMESPICPRVNNLFMEDFEIKAIRTVENPPNCGEDHRSPITIENFSIFRGRTRA